MQLVPFTPPPQSSSADIPIAVAVPNPMVALWPRRVIDIWKYSLGWQLEDLASRFDLSYQYEVASRDFTITRAPYTSENSLLSLLINRAAPTALSINNPRANNPRLVITNSGSLRLDIYSGPFTEDDQLTTSPFTTMFVYIPGIPVGVANSAFSASNRADESMKHGGTRREIKRRMQGGY